MSSSKPSNRENEYLCEDAFAQWDPEELCAMLGNVVQRTGLISTPPTLGEAKQAVDQTQQ